MARRYATRSVSKSFPVLRSKDVAPAHCRTTRQLYHLQLSVHASASGDAPLTSGCWRCWRCSSHQYRRVIRANRGGSRVLRLRVCSGACGRSAVHTVVSTHDHVPTSRAPVFVRFDRLDRPSCRQVDSRAAAISDNFGISADIAYQTEIRCITPGHSALPIPMVCILMCILM